MVAFPTYGLGTVSIAASGTTLTGSGTIWSGVNARSGDTIYVDGVQNKISDVTDETHLDLVLPSASAFAGVSYVIVQDSPLRFVGADAMADVSSLIAVLRAKGLLWYLPAGYTDPSGSPPTLPALTADDGQGVLKIDSGALWVMQSGAWVSAGVYKGFQYKGAYNAATAYAINDVLTSGGDAYIVTAPTTGNAPPNAAYYDLFASKGDKGDKGDTGPLPLEPVAPWATGTDYGVGPPASFVSQGGSSYQCLIPHTSATFATDLGAGKWGVVAAKGADGTGGGDMLKADNLAGLADVGLAERNIAPTNLNLSGTPDGTSPRIASYTDSARIMFGQEFLGSWISAWAAGNGRTAKVLLRGDSTMVGQNSGTAEYQPQSLFMAYARKKGVVFTATNLAVGSTTSADWLNTHLPSDLSTYTGSNIPALYVLNYGMNDAGGVADTVANLRAGFALLRGTWSAAQTSVVYMMPNSAYDDTNSRNEQWREDNFLAIRQACRDYGVMFFDTYAALREARSGVLSDWLDSNHVHPRDIHYSSIWGLFTDAVIPPSVVYEACKPRKPTLPSGWVFPGTAEDMVTEVVGSTVMGSGWMGPATSASIAPDTTLATIHLYHQVGVSAFGIDMVAYAGGSSTYQPFKAYITGNVLKNLETINSGVTRIYFGPGFWRL